MTQTVTTSYVVYCNAKKRFLPNYEEIKTVWSYLLLLKNKQVVLTNIPNQNRQETKLWKQEILGQ